MLDIDNAHIVQMIGKVRAQSNPSFDASLAIPQYVLLNTTVFYCHIFGSLSILVVSYATTGRECTYSRERAQVSVAAHSVTKIKDVLLMVAQSAACSVTVSSKWRLMRENVFAAIFASSRIDRCLSSFFSPPPCAKQEGKQCAVSGHCRSC